MHGEITVVDGIPVHRLAIRLPWELPVNPLAPGELRRRLTGGGFDVAHVQTGIVSPFAWDSTRVTLGLGPAHGDDVALHARGRRTRLRCGRLRQEVGGEGCRDVGRVGSGRGSASRARWARRRRSPSCPTGSTWPAGTPSTLSSVQHAPLRLVTAMRLAARKRPAPSSSSSPGPSDWPVAAPSR